MNTLLNNTYLQTAGILNQITALIKKTATTQLEIGKLILTVKNDYYTKLDAFKSDPKK